VQEQPPDGDEDQTYQQLLLGQGGMDEAKGVRRRD